MPRDPFKPLARHKSIVSDHPKTVINHEYTNEKEGIDLARHHDVGAFRMEKSRKLKKLRTSKEWSKLTDDQKAQAEAELIAELEKKLEKKMLRHEMEWRRIEEAENVESALSMKDNNESRKRKREETDVKEEWVTDEEEEEMVSDIYIDKAEEEEAEEGNEEESEVNINLDTVATDFAEILEVAGEGWRQKWETLRKQSEKKEMQWQRFIGGGGGSQ